MPQPLCTDAHDDYTPASAMSLRQLRADLLTRAAATAARARAARRAGHLRVAQALDHKAHRLAEIARSVKVS